ncbi:MAG TPA: hypothetical protein VF692_08060, partial [Pyrinomonadaceae bacterium]
YYFTPRLIDGGRVQLPNRAAFDSTAGEWGIENYGVAPDIDVEITPQDLMAGKDLQLEKAIEAAMAQIARNPVKQPKRPAFPIHPGKQEISGSNSVIPVPGSAFPAPTALAEVKQITDGKYAAYLGKFDTPMGVIVFSQEADKLIGFAGGERIELAPDATAKDKFAAQTASVNVAFERDAAEKVIGVTVIIPSGGEIKGKKID